MPIDSLLTYDVLIMVAAFSASGLVRGFNGGAGANFFTAPVLSLLIGPREAIPIVLLLSGVTNVQLAPGALPHVRWREALPIAGAAMITLPFGAWALFAIDEDVMRRLVAGMAVFFALLLLSGWRYRGPRGPGLSVGVGCMAGTITGAVSMGGPPVFLYLMSGPGDAVTNRAHFITFSVFAQSMSMAVFFSAGVYTERMLWLSVILLIPFVIATWIGTKLFHLASEATFRRVSLWLMAAVSLAILII